MAKLDYYSLMRNFWNFAFENPEIIKPSHCALYAFTVEHCNRLGWKQKFGLPASMVLDAIGIKSYSVYKKTFDDLVDFGFIEVVQYSKNQHSSNVISLVENRKENYKSYDKANAKHVENNNVLCNNIAKHITKQLPKHITKQLPKHITKHITKHGEYNNTNIPLYQFTNLPSTNVEGEKENFDDSDDLDSKIKAAFLESQKIKEKKVAPKKESNQDFAESLKFESHEWMETICIQQKKPPDKIIEKIDDFVKYLKTVEKEHPSRKEFVSHFVNWVSGKFKEETKAVSKPKFSINQ